MARPTTRDQLRAASKPKPTVAAALLVSLAAAGGVLAASSSASADVLTRAIAVTGADTLAIDPSINGLNELRLAGIDAAEAPLGRPLNSPWPLAEQARASLAALTREKTIRLAFAGQRTDRYRRLVDQVYRADGVWLQGELLRAGLARVHTTAENREFAREMLAIEAEARAARRGLWASPVYAVVSAQRVGDQIGSFALVEGRVIGARQVKKRVYLNFGADWRDDFTVTIDAASLPLFDEAGLDPLTLQGRMVRVRGWVETFNGPSIEATHPEQIEVLAEAGPEEISRTGLHATP